MKVGDIVIPIGILLAMGLAAGVVLERQALREINAQNDELRRQLGKMTELVAENQRLTDLVSRESALQSTPDGSGTNGLADDRQAESARLRDRLEAIHQQSNEVENLRADTKATQAALASLQEARNHQRLNTWLLSWNSSEGLRILQAQYGTEQTNINVAAELFDRSRGGSIKAVASNNLNGDPAPGQVKNLTVVYIFGGQTMTNHYNEGDLVILPPQGP